MLRLEDIADARPKRRRRDLGDILKGQLDLAGCGGFIREHHFHPNRQWRIDLAHPVSKLAIECEGFAAGGKAGRHQLSMHMHANCEKHAALAVMGWRLIRVTGQQIRSGEALRWIEAAIAGKGDASIFNDISPLSRVRKRRKAEQWTPAELERLRNQARPPMQFNRIRARRGGGG